MNKSEVDNQSHTNSHTHTITNSCCNTPYTLLSGKKMSFAKGGHSSACFKHI